MIVSVNRSTIYGNLEPNEPLLKKIVGLKVNRKKEQLHNNVPPWIEKKLSPQWMSMKETTITQKIRTRRC